MQTLKLIRTENDGVGVYGHLEIPRYDRDAHSLGTVENAATLIPDGKYPLRKTWSPRFQKLMPEICDVPNRAGIRIHQGTRPAHSTGCVLVSAFGLSAIDAIMNYYEKYYDNEKFQIDISTAGQG
jgi:hypothetical protein